MCIIYSFRSLFFVFVFFFKQKTAYEMLIRDLSSDVCSADLEDRIELILHVAALTVRLELQVKSAQNIVELVVECLTLDLQLIADLTVVVLAVQRLVEHKSGGIGGKPVIVAARLQFVLAIAKDILQRDKIGRAHV